MRFKFVPTNYSKDESDEESNVDDERYWCLPIRAWSGYETNECSASVLWKWMISRFPTDELEKMRPAYHCDFRKTFHPAQVRIVANIFSLKFCDTTCPPCLNCRTKYFWLFNEHWFTYDLPKTIIDMTCCKPISQKNSLQCWPVGV